MKLHSLRRNAIVIDPSRYAVVFSFNFFNDPLLLSFFLITFATKPNYTYAKSNISFDRMAGCRTDDGTGIFRQSRENE